MASVFIVFLSVFAELGLGPALVQKADLDESLLRRAFGVILFINVLLSAVLITSAPLIASFYGEPRLIPIIRVLSLQFILGAFSVIPNVLLARRMEFRKRSLLELSGAIVASLTTLTLAYGGGGVWALVAGSTLNLIWRTIGLNILSPFLRAPDFSLRGTRSLLTFGGQMTLAGVLATLFAQSDILIGAKLLGNEIIGYYSMAMELASMPSSKIGSIVNGVVFPAVSSIQHDLGKVGSNALLGTRILTFLSIPILWGVSSVSPEIVEVVLGPKWIPSIFPLQILTLVMPLRIVGNFLGVTVQGLGRADIVLRNTLWAFLLGPISLYTGAQLGGMHGLTVAWLVISPSLFFAFLGRGMPAMGLARRDALGAMLPSVIVGIIMYGGITVARHLIDDQGAGYVRLCILTFLGIFIYIIVSLGINRRGSSEAYYIFKDIMISRRAL